MQDLKILALYLATTPELNPDLDDSRNLDESLEVIGGRNGAVLLRNNRTRAVYKYFLRFNGKNPDMLLLAKQNYRKGLYLDIIGLDKGKLLREFYALYEQALTLA